MAVQVARIELGRVVLDIKVIEEILDKVGENPVAVISVSGPLQNGKSGIVNGLLRKLSSPEDIAVEGLWKPSHENQILMWPEPLMASPNGLGTAVLLMSIHGNPDGTVTTMENVLTVAFGCLLASVTVYHVRNGLSEDMLQFLQMVIACAKTVSQQDCCPFTQLLFAVNDWQLPEDYAFGVHEDGSGLSPRNFKEKLNVLTGIMPENRVVRQEILSGFLEVCCCLMPHFDDQTIEGLEQLQDIVNWIFREGRCISKTVHGKEVTGTEFKALVQEWAESLVISKIPVLRTDIDGPREVTNASALSVALKFFRMEVASATNGSKRLTDAMLGEVLDQKKREAMAMLERMIITEQETVFRRYVAILVAEIDEFTGEFLKKKAEKQQRRKRPLSESVQIQQVRPGLPFQMCPEKDSERWRCICWSIVFFHILLGGGIILWLTYRHLSPNGDEEHQVLHGSRGHNVKP